jgi:hypothetical protein
MNFVWLLRKLRIHIITDPVGVSQRNHMSTLLFNILINYFLNVIINSNILIFDDDAKLVKMIVWKKWYWFTIRYKKTYICDVI